MTTSIDFEFNFGIHNGSMNLSLYSNEKCLIEYKNVDRSSQHFSTTVTWPTQLKLYLSNKHSSDTKVNEHGEIVADKYIQLVAMKIGRIPVSVPTLFKICRYHRDQFDDDVIDTFWGFNGIVTIDLDHRDFVCWHLKNNNIFETR
jgi:hypothetical protein